MRIGKRVAIIIPRMFITSDEVSTYTDSDGLFSKKMGQAMHYALIPGVRS